MAVERTQNSAPKEFGIFFAGAGGWYEGMNAIGTRMRSLYGKDNYKIYNSALFTSPHSVEKLPEVSKLIVDRVNKGEHVLITAHSFGASEAVEALIGTEQVEEGFLDAHASDIELDFISPTPLIKNWRQGVAYLGRFSRLVVNEISRTPYKSGFYRGIVSLTTIPPSSEIINQLHIKTGLRKAFAKQSNVDGTLPEREYDLDRDYLSHVDPHVREEVTALDMRLAGLMSDPEKNKKRIKKVIKRRAKLTHQPIEDAYAMKFADKFNDEPVAHPEYQWTVPAVLGLLRLAGSTFFTGRSYRQFQELLGKGVGFRLTVPDFDQLFREKHLKRALGEDVVRDKSEIVYGTHTSPYAVQPNMIQ